MKFFFVKELVTIPKGNPLLVLKLSIVNMFSKSWSDKPKCPCGSQTHARVFRYVKRVYREVCPESIMFCSYCKEEGHTPQDGGCRQQEKDKAFYNLLDQESRRGKVARTPGEKTAWEEKIEWDKKVKKEPWLELEDQPAIDERYEDLRREDELYQKRQEEKKAIIRQARKEVEETKKVGGDEKKILEQKRQEAQDIYAQRGLQISSWAWEVMMEDSDQSGSDLDEDDEDFSKYEEWESGED